jgi:hypothetical protein
LSPTCFDTVPSFLDSESTVIFETFAPLDSSEIDLPRELMSVLVRAQLCMNAGMIETSFRKPRVGAPRCPFDQLAGLRELIWRFGQRTERRHYKIVDAMIKAPQLVY